MTMNHEYFISYSICDDGVVSAGRTVLTLDAPIDSTNIAEMLEDIEQHIADTIGTTEEVVVLTNWKYLGSTIDKKDIQ